MRGVAFVLLEIGLCGVGLAYASRLTFHPVECKIGISSADAIEHNKNTFAFGGIKETRAET